MVVHCTPELQLSRLRERDGLDEAAARARIEAQLSSASKREFAHFEIDSSGTPGDTETAADTLARTLGGLAADAPEARGRGGAGFVGGLLHGPQDGPRGLSPALLLSQAGAALGLDMEALASRLVPPARGPWYRAGEEVLSDAPACRLGVALAAWGDARRGPDADFVAAATASVARLIHADAASRSDACLAALVALERFRAEGEEATVAALAASCRPLAVRFGGGAPSGRLEAVWSALARFPRDPAEAGALATRLGGDGPTAAALAGLGLEARGAAAAAWRAALEAVR